jgi:hypothetical protein
MAAAQPDVPLTHRRLLFILAVMLGMFLAALDQTSIAIWAPRRRA